MKLTKCETCLGKGYVKDTDVFAEEEDVVECKECEASGYVELMPF